MTRINSKTKILHYVSLTLFLLLAADVVLINGTLNSLHSLLAFILGLGCVNQVGVDGLPGSFGTSSKSMESFPLNCGVDKRSGAGLFWEENKTMLLVLKVYHNLGRVSIC